MCVDRGRSQRSAARSRTYRVAPIDNERRFFITTDSQVAEGDTLTVGDDVYFVVLTSKAPLPDADATLRVVSRRSPLWQRVEVDPLFQAGPIIEGRFE